jgi:hypothetical protein
MAANPESKFYLRLVVYRGEPLDYQKYRHVGLWFTLEDGSESFVMHIIGPNMEYEL